MAKSDVTPTNPSGLCMCGCGATTNISKTTRSDRGLLAGHHVRYAHGHSTRTRPNHIGPNGYAVVAGAHEHRIVVERALGKAIPDGACVHHVNGDRTDNRPANLVLCESAGYHQLIHIRHEALRACGHADWRKCEYCKKYDAPENLYIKHRSARHGWRVRHRECHAAAVLRAKRKMARGH